ncbi:Altered inheritance of mitochondria protein 6 [Onygenales sp. PD_12]|nr:Altered inheritance of mitochondria protein 6 [Onygenales sp. PD_12]
MTLFNSFPLRQTPRPQQPPSASEPSSAAIAPAATPPLVDGEVGLESFEDSFDSIYTIHGEHYGRYVSRSSFSLLTDDSIENAKHAYDNPLISRWTRLWDSFLRRRKNPADLETAEASCLGESARRSTTPGKARRAVSWTLILLGLVKLITMALGVFASFFPSDVDKIIARWGQPGHRGEFLSPWPSGVTGNVIPIPCHSHNDYWRPVPLFSALRTGCIGVEADVWLFDQELYVGHTTSSLTPNRTLTTLYIDPLVEILDMQNPVTRFHPVPDHPPNGVFDTRPSQTLALLIDFKNNGEEIWPHLLSQLSPLRERGYLTHFNGTDVVERPITVVATGNAPFDLLMANDTYRDVFFDAPLENMLDDDESEDFAKQSPISPPSDDFIDVQQPELDELNSIPTPRRVPRSHRRRKPPEASLDPPARPTLHITPPPPPLENSISDDADPTIAIYNPTNSYYASVSFRKSIGFPWRLRLSRRQVDLIRLQVRGAHARGLKVRYWSIPSWPRSLRNYLWTVLVEEGVDILNVDDLKSAARRDWGWRGMWGL